MIPKIIHYCWFGNAPKDKKVQRCIESWKKFLPDYEIKEWNNSNVDLDMMPFVRKAYECGKFAFASDVIRLWALYNYGGIYFDTDVEVVKSFDALLFSKGFIGFENDSFVNTGQCVAAEKGSRIIGDMIEFYKNFELLEQGGAYKFIGCPIVNTEVLKNYGLVCNGQKQDLDGFIVYPAEYFNPYNDIIGKLSLTENTYSIHWYSKSWMSRRKILRSKLSKPLHRFLNMIKNNKR